MNVLLFNQYFTSNKDNPESNLACLPLNLLHLATFLKSKNIDCKIYELGVFDPKEMIIENNRARFGLPDEKITEIIKQEKPSIIGLSCMYSRHYIDIINLAKLIKDIDPEIVVITGGNHATSFSEMVLKNKFFDFVVKGEGEITFYELCKKIIAGEKDFSQVKGLVYKEGDKILTNPPRELIPNLDNLPMLDYELVDLKKYIATDKKSYAMRFPAISITTSRGCPGQCVYCTVRAVWGRSWRGKSPKRTVDEMEILHKKYGVNEFSFLDDSASVNKERWKAICEEIIKRKLDIKWTTPNGIAHWTLDKPMLKIMKKSGCYRITFGIESGNVETRKFLGKPYPLSQAKELIGYANRLGMWTICTHILGFPYETREQMEDTIRFAKKSGTDFATFYLLCPMPTSDVYQYFKKEDLLDLDFVFNDNNFDEEKYEMMNNILNDLGVPTKNFQPPELKKIALNAYRSFMVYRAFTYLNPLRLINKIHSFEDINYMRRLFISGIKMLTRTFYRTTSKSIIHN